MVSSTELARPLDRPSSEISRSPMIFNIGRAFRGRAQPELDGPESMLFVELACGMVLLVRVKLQAVGIQCLSKEDGTRPPAFSPLDRIDKHPVDVRTSHCQKRDNLPVACTHPDVAARANHFPKDVASSFQRELLPAGKEPVGRLSRTVPHPNDSSLIVILERPDRCGRIIQGGIPSLRGGSANV